MFSPFIYQNENIFCTPTDSSNIQVTLLDMSGTGKARRNGKQEDTKTSNKMADANIMEMLVTIRAEMATLRSDFMTELCSSVSSLRAGIMTEVQSTMPTLQTTFATQTQKIKDMETPLTNIDKRLTKLETKNDKLTSENVKLKVSLDEQENRSQRQIIRVVGNHRRDRMTPS